ncbi:MAG: hypothetical protein EBT79_05050 [Actinobacteria bacterium]|nr:hypothetical protein [Actinomycetota bacterium]NBR66640.1 hypothetical protein [Actinomycetota bacterium]
MPESFGPGVSRTLSAIDRQFQTVIWQRGKPPLDSELNLMSQVDVEALREVVRSQVHSGILLDPTRATGDYVTDPQFSNQFRLGIPAADEASPVLTAVVNGWVIPVAGTGMTGAANLVRLSPPPASDSRIDLVFLEAWLARVAPNPSTVNKPSSTTVWRYGNVEYGGTNVPDDIQDPAIGFETTERVQVQYRIRVYGSGASSGASIALDVYPDGLGDPNVLGQGTAVNPVAGFPFVNMREALGDPSLWRAGNGDPNGSIGTVDGYTYAVPLCAVFRRNASGYATVEPAGAANQNGSFDRNAVAASFVNPRDGARVLSAPALSADIDETALIIPLSNLTGSGFDTLTPAQIAAGVYALVGGEIVGPIVTVGAASITVTGRGRGGTMAVPHASGDAFRFYNVRPDGLFADQVAPGDILDLRHGVTFGDWDYTRLLVHNLSNLVLNNLRTSYKESATGDTQGVQVIDVGYLSAVGPAPISSQQVDGPDGIRTVFSDAATVQSDVTVVCHDVTASGADTALDTGVDWDPAAPFLPSGFFPDAGYSNGTVLFLNIGGTDGTEGARASFYDGADAVRFVAPFEMWKYGDEATVGRRTPVTMRWLGHDGFEAAPPGGSPTAGPMYPTPESNFERPFLVMGGILNAASDVSAPVLYSVAGGYEVQLPGLNFDAPGGWWNGTDVTSSSPDGITNSVLQGRRTLYDLLTRGGSNRDGTASEVYLVLYGDTTTPTNNGVVRVIGAGDGTAGYTSNPAAASDRVRVEFIVEGVSTFTTTSAPTNAELRSQYTDATDGSGGSLGGPASLAIVITDIEGASAYASKWNGIITAPEATSELVINTTLQYHPGRGAMPRVPDRVWDVAGVSIGTEYLRQSRAALDATFAGQVGLPTSQTRFDYAHVGTWNRLPSLGLSAPDAPSYGGEVAVFSEQTRESEVFIDPGSKTVVLRPFRTVDMTLYGFTFVTPDVLLGTSTYPASASGPPAGTPKDAAGIFGATLKDGFVVPAEFMPRFGRQDIPYRVGSNATFLAGINHLFTDTTTAAAAVTNVVGGQDAGGVGGIEMMYLQTGASSGVNYCGYGTVATTGLSAYQGRLFYSDQVVSTDLGRGMRGIQLPPYLGTARVFGVYDRRDFVAKGGATFDADRITVATNPATNLLRTDATKQTLFILQGGAQDITGDADDHTYIIPSEAIDITLSPTYVAGEVFDDLEYVVVFACFGFARGFINKNNIVLSRRNNGSGVGPTMGSLSPVSMTIPVPAASNDEFFVGYTRTPYQGDPYMTRAGDTRVVTDYQARYGQVPVSDQYLLRTPIQQFEPDGTRIPQTPNRRSLQVLAAVDFYTTLGTGKMGGLLYPGTVTDCGHTENDPNAAKRCPEAATSPEWRVVPRTFTDGQPAVGRAATLRLVVGDNTKVVVGNTVTVSGPGFSTVTLTAGTEFAIGATAADTATNIAAAMTLALYPPSILLAITFSGIEVFITAVIPGADGNQIRISTNPAVPGGTTGIVFARPDGSPVLSGRFGSATSANLVGGVDIPVNAGDGSSLINMTGFTDRLPLGILLQDSDFLCENPLGDTASALATSPSGVIQAAQTVIPLAGEAREYTPFLGGPGQWVALSDGGILTYTAYTDATPTGSKRFRLYRGGGSAFVVSEPTPGGPLSWTAGSFPSSLEPVLKGGVLACKAMLVRNMPEEAFSTPSKTSPGDEVQMVVVTYGILGDGHTQMEGIDLGGIISPTGYGEGFAAADRYRIEGRPMVVARVREYPAGDAEPAIYPVPGTGTPTTSC